MAIKGGGGGYFNNRSANLDSYTGDIKLIGLQI